MLKLIYFLSALNLSLPNPVYMLLWFKAPAIHIVGILENTLLRANMLQTVFQGQTEPVTKDEINERRKKECLYWVTTPVHQALV